MIDSKEIVTTTAALDALDDARTAMLGMADICDALVADNREPMHCLALLSSLARRCAETVDAAKTAMTA